MGDGSGEMGDRSGKRWELGDGRWEIGAERDESWIILLLTSYFLLPSPRSHLLDSRTV